MENLNLAFYTYFIGSDNNPAFLIPVMPTLKYKCYYYTNNKTIFERLKDTNWIRIFIDIETTDDIYESNMFGKHLKAMPHEYKEIKDYDYLCYLDNKLPELSDEFIENHIQKYFINDKYALILRQHPILNNYIWSEYTLSMYQPRYKNDCNRYFNYIVNQMSSGKFVDEDKYHCTCSFLLRNMKHEKIIELNSTWYNHIQECGIQDQISFFFVKQLFADYILPIKERPFKDINTTLYI
jgi:hypothetical protein